MNPKLNILHVFSRKALCFAFILLIGFSFSAGGVLANKGDPFTILLEVDPIFYAFNFHINVFSRYGINSCHVLASFFITCFACLS